MKTNNSHNFHSSRHLLALVWVLLTVTFTGCVGQIEDTKKDTTESERRSPASVLSFAGIVDAVPVADDKIEVYFFPATGGSGRYSYQVYVGDDPNPHTGTEDTLEKDYRGLFRMLVTGLVGGTPYAVKVDAKDLDTELEIKSESTLTRTTFTNQVANFYGISSVSNASGVDGIDSIWVRWVPADKDPAAPFGSPRDPQTYEVIILDASKVTPAAFNNPNLTESQGRIVRSIVWDAGLNKAMIRGLQSNKEYYVNIRTIHKGSIVEPSNPALRSELNNRYLKIKTLEAGVGAVNFEESEYKVLPAPGQSALNSLVASWGAVTGVFDHLRVYYAKSGSLNVSVQQICPAATSTTISSNDTACKKVSGSAVSVTLSDLPSLTNFDVQLVICLNATCTADANSSGSIVNPGLKCTGLTPAERCSARTESTLASFIGIQDVESARSVSEVGSMFLKYTTPSFDIGYFDGFAIEFTTDKTGLNNWLQSDTNPKPTTEIIYAGNASIDYNGDLTIQPFEYDSDSEIRVTGADYGAGDEHCYSIYPFLYDDSVEGYSTSMSESLKKVWQCEKAQAQAPDSNGFTGFNSGVSVGPNVTVDWTPPSRGVFTHYEIFTRKGDTAVDTNFSFTNAIQDTTADYVFDEYNRILLSSEAGAGIQRTSHTITGLTDGRWIIGIMTYYLGGGTLLRSQETLKLLYCDIDGGSINSTNCTVSQ